MTLWALVLTLVLPIPRVYAICMQPTSVKRVPALLDVVFVAVTGAVIYANGESWMFTFWCIGAGVWILTFVFAPVRHHYTQENAR